MTQYFSSYSEKYTPIKHNFYPQITFSPLGNYLFILEIFTEHVLHAVCFAKYRVYKNESWGGLTEEKGNLILKCGTLRALVRKKINY